MKTIGCYFFILVLSASCLSRDATGGRKTVPINDNWKFIKASPAGAQNMDFDASGWQTVRIPHDWAIAGPFDPNGNPNTGKLPWQGQGWYRKTFDIAAADAGKCVYFLFDGVMAMPDVFINGQRAGGWDYGYNSFWVDASEFVKFGGTNLLAVSVDTTRHDSRWYPGAGIYRKVQMIITDPVHVGQWGTYIQTPKVTDTSADIEIQTAVENRTGKEQRIDITTKIVDPSGKEVAALTVSDVKITGSGYEFKQTMKIADPILWDIQTPRMYTAWTIISKNGDICDTYKTPFGIRTIQWTAEDGFHLNGRRLQLKGVCLHHDQGPLGAAFLPRAMERQLEIMRDMGCNAIRTSHNVPAPELLDLCDRMGFVVYNEAFDKWDEKADFQKDMDFEEFGQRQIRNFVMRDRNHPCVILWSVGNEMGDIQSGKSNGFAKLQKMVGFVKEYDKTRLVTMACNVNGTIKLGHWKYYDVHSWNYGRKYAEAHRLDSTRPTVVSESASTVSTRGFYELPLPKKKTGFTSAGQVSSYDLNTPSWAEIPDDDFMWQELDTYCSGEFVWTGIDYLGEPTPYHEKIMNKEHLTCSTARSSYFGIVDLAGIPKDRFYLYRSHWAPEKTTVHILPHWNWDGWEGKPIPVFVYTSGDSAELFLNNKSLGKKSKQPDSKISTERYRLRWDDVIYQPGQLKAVAYKDGKVVGEAITKTAGKPSQIRLTPDRKQIASTGDDLSYVLVEMLDADGNICPKADNQIQFKISGPGVLAGVCNGDPQSLESMQGDTIRLFFGKAIVIVRSTENRNGDIVLTAETGDIAREEVQIQSKSF